MKTLKTSGRLYVLAGTVLVVYFMAGQLRGTLRPENVKFPEWDLEDMPLQLGQWQGRKTEDVDRRIFVATGADKVLDRVYQDENRNVVSVHTAIFSRYASGVTHNPTVCYRTHGWQLLKSDDLQLQVEDREPVSVRLSTWEREGEQVLMVYWYQLGDQMLFDRGGLGRARLSLLGKEEWPPLLKVLMQTSGSNPQAGRDRIQSLAERVCQWLQHPERQAAVARPTQ